MTLCPTGAEIIEPLLFQRIQGLHRLWVLHLWGGPGQPIACTTGSARPGGGDADTDGGAGDAATAGAGLEPPADCRGAGHLAQHAGSLPGPRRLAAVQHRQSLWPAGWTSGAERELDLVFVRGLGGHPFSTMELGGEGIPSRTRIIRRGMVRTTIDADWSRSAVLRRRTHQHHGSLQGFGHFAV